MAENQEKSDSKRNTSGFSQSALPWCLFFVDKNKIITKGATALLWHFNLLLSFRLFHTFFSVFLWSLRNLSRFICFSPQWKTIWMTDLLLILTIFHFSSISLLIIIARNVVNTVRKLWRPWEKHGTMSTSHAAAHAKNQCPPSHSSKRKAKSTASQILRNCSPQNVRVAKIQLQITPLWLWMLNGIRIASCAK